MIIKDFIRACRLPFISASILPFVYGSFIVRKNFHWSGFFLGLFSVVFTHLSANLINDYADSMSGVDWIDKRFFGFFGGSKLIQQGRFSYQFYFVSALLFAVLALASVIGLSFVLKDIRVVFYYTGIIFLSWAYSVKPVCFSYRKFGEIIIFLLFGPVLVMGGYFIQSRVFPDLKSLAMSVPSGLFVSAILFVNEIPDYYEDIKKRKITWVCFLGPDRSFVFYEAILFSAFLAIALNIMLGFLSWVSIFSFLCLLLVLKAVKVLRGFSRDKIKLVESSRLTILTHILVNLILIIDVITRKCI